MMFGARTTGLVSQCAGGPAFSASEGPPRASFLSFFFLSFMRRVLVEYKGDVHPLRGRFLRLRGRFLRIRTPCGEDFYAYGEDFNAR